MIALHFLMFFWLCDSVLLQESVPKKNGSFIQPSSAEEKSAALTVAATGVISFIAILVVIVIILVCVVSLRFRCHHCKNVEDKQKPQHPIVSYSCSDAEAAVGKKNVMLVSMKDLNISNSQGAAKCITHEN
ncbi:endothelial cell-specific chemotaxis regulator isoform X3 [Podarcis raffonei]|uniref:endothelial cell-specific chemotaxis regulator isoform X3 n=1 Tax=Podarcis raffonei TaxID=65483 RepID=UPI002329952D|nr:endothelial cell-specific chemotaxis regulator isoform X3 [Podarcis raffonei]